MPITAARREMRKTRLENAKRKLESADRLTGHPAFNHLSDTVRELVHLVADVLDELADVDRDLYSLNEEAEERRR